MSKVLMGLEYPIFAPIKSEGTTGYPVYDTITVIGELITANLTVSARSGELYSDNALNIKISEWASASLAMDTDGIDDAVAEAIFGCTVTAGEVVYKSSDVAPFGGLAYYREMVDKTGKHYYQGVYFPKVQAVLGNDNASTKGSSLSFQTRNTTFNIMEANDGIWQVTETFDTEPEAKTWITGKLTASAGG